MSEADRKSPSPVPETPPEASPEAPPEAAPVPATARVPQGILFESWAEIVVLFCLLAVMGVLGPDYGRRRPSPRANTRACFANQKTVMGAMEMYNLDKNTKRMVLDPDFFQALKSGGYLQSIPQDPGEGPGTSSHYQATESANGIRCTVHGQLR